jgi:glycerophosphoryl diester phosphodiesterase
VTPLLFGHGPDTGPHAINTLPSFAWCRDHGVDGIECDVRLTADGRPVVIHDPVVPVDGPAIASTDRRDLPAWIPDLEAVLDACAGLVVNLELKNFPRDPGFDPSQRVTHAVLELLAQRAYRDRVLVSCFDVAALDVVREEAGQHGVRTGMLYLSRRAVAELLDPVVDHGHGAVHPYDTMVDAAFMEQASARALDVHVWTGEVGEDRFGALVQLGVAGIITADLVRCRAAIDAAERP